ncbi:tryptophan synthase subunit alpha [Empedobacter tilapiae]|uniref:Tryptophan synthase alpha chain n=1 Tax=Empedobacter tilapiae TaxID=2491114 RepID=A0A4Z1CAQ5_9FLAO|nr:tryptophan synthase subunit alpha [Empedobacter tilapiae]TGN29361.1 tryptophan synthase subunit alpha [Empedobacter tilapiae]
MNKLEQLFTQKNNNLITIYTTAGYPNLSDTPVILKELDRNNVDIIEIGIPYSDPLADGPTIQATSEKALVNGMTLDILFKQLKSVQNEISSPIVLMGYYNQVMTFGLEKFLQNCQESGVSGLILPDMPYEIYLAQHKELFEKYDQKVTFLITPLTTEKRIKEINDATSGFVYIVSSSATTGATTSNYNEVFLSNIKNLGLTKPHQIGFGISTKEDVEKAWEFSNGAIIGSAFLRLLEKSEGNFQETIKDYIQSLR